MYMQSSEDNERYHRCWGAEKVFNITLAWLCDAVLFAVRVRCFPFFLLTFDSLLASSLSDPESFALRPLPQTGSVPTATEVLRRIAGRRLVDSSRGTREEVFLDPVYFICWPHSLEDFARTNEKTKNSLALLSAFLGAIADQPVPAYAEGMRDFFFSKFLCFLISQPWWASVWQGTGIDYSSCWKR